VASSPAASTSAVGSPAPSASASAQDLAALPAQELFAKSMDYTGVIETIKADLADTSGSGSTDHMEINQLRGDCAATESLGGSAYLALVVLNPNAWARLEDGYWTGHPSDPTAGQLKGHYVQVSKSNQHYRDVMTVCHLDNLLQPLLAGGSGAFTKGEPTSVDGHRAVWLTRPTKDGGTTNVLISLEDEPYIRQVKSGTMSLTLSAFNAPVTINQPPADQVVQLPDGAQMPGF
jgi:hypothetical protein